MFFPTTSPCRLTRRCSPTGNIRQASPIGPPWRPQPDDEPRKVAWRKLTDAFGANRAAWVALATKPANWDDLATVGAAGLTFVPPVQTKPDSWSEAPHTRVLPDRLVLMLFRGSAVVYTAVGNQIDDLLAVGPAPTGRARRQASLPRRRQPHHLRRGLALADGFRRGLEQGTRLPRSARPCGFRRLRRTHGPRPQAFCRCRRMARRLLEQLIDAQHYSKNGFALVPQGTPTNNTSRTDSGFDGRDWFSDESYVVQRRQAALRRRRRSRQSRRRPAPRRLSRH